MAGQGNVKQLEECSVSNYLPKEKQHHKGHFHLFSAESVSGDFRMDNKVLLVISCSSYIALGTWVFSVAGALIAIPVGIKRKSLAPLVFFGTTGTMLDIIMGISACEREHAERQRQLLETQNACAVSAGTES